MTQILFLSAAAGALHVLAPDHWMPASVLAWQRGWRVSRVALFSFVAFSFHVGLGLAVYFAVRTFLIAIDPSRLILFAFVFLSLIALFRALRYRRIQEVLRSGSNGIWGFFAVISLLGPAEFIVPVFIRSNSQGTGYLAPLSAFLAGTLAMGTAVIWLGRGFWDRPLALPRGMSWVGRTASLIPLICAIAVGVTLLLRWA